VLLGSGARGAQLCPAAGIQKKEESSFSEEKEAKRLLFLVLFLYPRQARNIGPLQK
jgi:hypothetical protein